MIKQIRKVKNTIFYINKNYNSLTQKSQKNHTNICQLCEQEPIEEDQIIEGREELKNCEPCAFAINFAQKEFPQFSLSNMPNAKLLGFFTPQIDCILENRLYLGNKNASKQLELLQKHNITDILAAGNRLPENFPDHFNYKTLHIEDTNNEEIFGDFKQAIDFIDQGKVVFVHCFAGVSRSSSMVIAYLMAKQGMKFDEALKHVQDRRWKAQPNQNFQNQLKKFQEQIQYKKQ